MRHLLSILILLSATLLPCTAQIDVHISPAESDTLNIPQRTPQIALSSTGIVCSWVDREADVIVSRLPYPLGTAEIQDSVHASPVPYKVHLGHQPVDVRNVVTTKSIIANSISSIPGGLLLTSNRTDYYDLQYALNFKWYDESPTGHIYRFYRSDGNGWDPLYENGTAPHVYFVPQIVYAGDFLQYLPRREEYVFGLMKVNADNWKYSPQGYYDTLLALKANGSLAWKSALSSQPVGAYLLPVDSAEYLEIGSNRVRRMKGETDLYDFPLEPGNPVRIHRLNDSTFIRIYTPLSSPGLRMIESWSITGTLHGRQESALAEEDLRSGNYAISFREHDNTVVLLWGTEADGIHAEVFNRELQPVEPNLRVSGWRGKAQRPVALFTNDTLIVLWEDYRNDNADIYGTSVVIPYDTTSSVPSSQDEANKDRVQLWPNPVRDNAILSIKDRGGQPVVVTLFDLMGQMVFEKRIEGENESLTLDLSEVEPGAYYMQVVSGNHRSEVLFVRM